MAVCAVVLTPAHAGDLLFSWDPSSGAAGYRVHFGTSPGQYTGSQDVGAATQASLQNLGDCVTRYYAVVAYNGAGDSGFSNEVASWPRPALASAAPSVAQVGTTATLSLDGTNFQVGSTVQIDNPGVTIASVTRNSCSSLTISVNISGSASLGPAAITVTNPNGVAGSAAGLFSVVGETLPPVQNLRRIDTQ